MKISVNFDELDLVKKTQISNKDELEIEINNMVNCLERLKNIWQGDEFDSFYDNAYNYINRMKVLTAFMSTSSDFISNVGKNYKEQDSNFADLLDKEEMLLDEQNSNNRH